MMLMIEAFLTFSILIQCLEWIYLSRINLLAKTYLIPTLILLISAISWLFWPSEAPVLLGLICYVVIAWKFHGPFNGGSDQMTMIGLQSLLMIRFIGGDLGIKIGITYWTLHVLLSYFLPGYRKLRNQDWRQGRAISYFLRSSTYQSRWGYSLLKKISNPHLNLLLHWSIITLEIGFIFVLFLPNYLFYSVLAIGFGFHLMVAVLFRLNRFFWAWIATYPVLIFFKNYLLRF